MTPIEHAIEIINSDFGFGMSSIPNTNLCIVYNSNNNVVIIPYEMWDRVYNTALDLRQLNYDCGQILNKL